MAPPRCVPLPVISESRAVSPSRRVITDLKIASTEAELTDRIYKGDRCLPPEGKDLGRISCDHLQSFIPVCRRS